MIVPCSALWPKSPHLEDVIPHWGFLAGRLHGSPLTRPLLLALRGAKHGDAMTHQPVHRPAYDDAFVLLQPSGAIPVDFDGATHAYQLNSAESPDVNGDGVGDVASIKPGTYLLTDLRAGSIPIFGLTTPGGSDHIPCWRDTDHHGVISEMEAAYAASGGEGGESVGLYATAVLMHTGFDAPPQSAHRSSIACQTASLRWLEAMAVAAKPFGGLIDYVLVNAWDAVALVPELDNPPGLVA